MYPYEAGSTHLSQLFPPWAFDGGVEHLLHRLGRQMSGCASGTTSSTACRSWGNLLNAAGGWDRILVNGVVEPAAELARGRFISHLAAEAGADGLDVACDLILAIAAAPRWPSS